MSGLDSIPVFIEGARTENLKPLLMEVEQALRELIDSGKETIIDLAAMPFSDQDELDLREFLGSGEVSAIMNAYGPTSIEETGLPGVWWVEHKDAEERRLTLHLEITRVPAILMTPEDDLGNSLSRLQASISPSSETESGLQ